MNKFLAIIVTLFLFVNCKKKECTPKIQEEDINWIVKYGAADKYMPNKNGNYWIYEVKKVDSTPIRTIGLDTLTMKDTSINNGSNRGKMHKFSPIRYCHFEPFFIFRNMPNDTFTHCISYNNVLYPLISTSLPNDTQVKFDPSIFNTKFTSNYMGGVLKYLINGIKYDSCKTATLQYGLSKTIGNINTYKTYTFTFVFAKNIGIISMNISYNYSETGKKTTFAKYYYTLKDYKLN